MQVYKLSKDFKLEDSWHKKDGINATTFKGSSLKVKTQKPFVNFPIFLSAKCSTSTRRSASYHLLDHNTRFDTIRLNIF